MRGEIFVTHHLYFLSSGSIPDDGSLPPNGLASRSGSSGISVYTGIHTGPVSVSVSCLRSSPSLEVGWDDIVETSIEITAPFRVATLMSDVPDDFNPVVQVATGPHRVRVHCKGRDTDCDGSPPDVVEWYLVQLWPAPLQDDVLIRGTDLVGRRLRDHLNN